MYCAAWRTIGYFSVSVYNLFCMGAKLSAINILRTKLIKESWRPFNWMELVFKKMLHWFSKVFPTIKHWPNEHQRNISLQGVLYLLHIATKSWFQDSYLFNCLCVLDTIHLALIQQLTWYSTGPKSLTECVHDNNTDQDIFHNAECFISVKTIT